MRVHQATRQAEAALVSTTAKIWLVGVGCGAATVAVLVGATAYINAHPIFRI
jgi:predicted naringenin-chalcone synthase